MNFTITSNLAGQVIPEDDEATSGCGSISGTDSSPEEREEDEDDDKSLNYPPDLLGMSWGSYLHSGPPTRSGNNPLIRGHHHHMHSTQGSVLKRVMVSNTTPKQFENGDNSIPNSSDHHARPSPSVGSRSILDGKVDEEPAPNVGLPTHVSQPRPLFSKLEILVRTLSSSKKELSKCGVETTPLIALSDAAHSSHYDLKQLVAELGDKKQFGSEILSSGVLHSVIDYLSAVLESLVVQGKKLNEQAVFLQKTGKQLGRNQHNFLQEQKEIQQAIESAREQLLLEKVSLCF